MNSFKRFFDFIGIGAVLFFLCVLFTLQSDIFPTPRNLSMILVHTSVNIIIAAGMTYVICAAEIDLSVGSLLALCGMTTAMILKLDPETGRNIPMAFADALTSPLPDLFYGNPTWWALAVLSFLFLALLPGALAGGASGFIVVRFGVPSFIVTLGFMLILRGLARWLTNAAPITGMPPQFMQIGAGVLYEFWEFRITYSAVIALSVALLAAVVLAWTRFGRHVMAVGGNRQASYLSGAPVARTRFMVFVVSGLCAAIASIIQTSRIFMGDPNAGEGYELDAIAAVVIGGASLFGGKGGVIGALFGALIIGVLRNGLELMEVTDHIKQMVIGGMIIFAVLLDYYRRRLYGESD
ncbi:MAG: ABC transporter permease [Candidatus Hinthialibacter antarcticus]|nr:ABC transporter permease [Candidatus Hinthialibacter antarcticus]